MALPAVVTALFAAGPYVTFSFSRVPLDPSLPVHVVFLSLHGLASGTALLLGPLQFVKWIRVRRPRVHRNIGRAYLVAVSVGAVCALASAIASQSGWSAQVGFVLLALFWIYTAVRAFREVVTGRFAEHRVWMMRNYSATFAAVLLRAILLIEQLLLPLTGVELAPRDAYDVAVWGSITISIIGAELFVVQRSLRAVLPAHLTTSTPPPHRRDTIPASDGV